MKEFLEWFWFEYADDIGMLCLVILGLLAAIGLITVIGWVF